MIENEPESSAAHLRRLRLLSRIERRYRTVVATIQVGNLKFSFTRIAEPDQVLDDAVEQEDRRLRLPKGPITEPPRMPYWAELWESALGLGQVIERTGPGTANVLDLGCGMGLAGMVAAAMGHRVWMVELETSALLLARLNTLPWAKRVRCRRINWQSDRISQRFDLILGADILYEIGQWEPLHAFWQAHLAPGGTVMLGEPGRGTADQFEAWAKQRKWQVEQSTECVATLANPIRIFKLRRH
ncbi:MAG: methyltransferase [Tepidisphaeraceae bacterium]|jgi:predicted nicotinamide N-methyase